MGLPGSGKTHLAQRLVPLLKVKLLNNDKVREEADTDFSLAGRKAGFKNEKFSSGTIK